MAENDSRTETKKPRRERGSGRLWKIGNIWYIQYYVNGAQRRETTRSTDEKFARKLLNRRIGEAAAGTYRELRRVTYEDLRRAFFDDYITNKRKSLRWTKDGEPRLDPVTRLDGFFSGYRASVIDAELMVKFQKKLQASGKSDATINLSLAALRKMFSIAKKNRTIREVPYFPRLKLNNVRKGTLPHDKYPELLAALPERLRPVLALGYHTGMRLGEIQRLRWEQVKFLDGVIRLDPGETKNDEGRAIPVNEELMRVLKAEYLKREPGCPLVCGRNGRAIRDFRRVWYDRCSKLGLGTLEKRPGRRRAKYRGLIFHDLRRTFITDAENSGAPRHEIMKGTGHKTESVYKRYAIGSVEGQRAATERVAAYRAALNGAKTGQMEVFQAVEEAAGNVTTLTKQ